MGRVSTIVHARAEKQAVWDVLTDSDRWAEWGDFTDSVRVEGGDGHPDGVGSVREVWTAALLPARERVETFDPEAGVYEYSMLSGLPLRDYLGRVELTAADGGGTTIAWTVTWRTPLPLPLLDAATTQLLRVVIGRLAGALAARAATVAPAA